MDADDETSKRRKLLQEALELDRDDSENEDDEKEKKDEDKDGEDKSEDGRYVMNF